MITIEKINSKYIKIIDTNNIHIISINNLIITKLNDVYIVFKSDNKNILIKYDNFTTPSSSAFDNIDDFISYLNTYISSSNTEPINIVYYQKYNTNSDSIIYSTNNEYYTYENYAFVNTALTPLTDGLYDYGFNDDVLSSTSDSQDNIYVVGKFTSFNNTTYNRIVKFRNQKVDTTFNIGTGFNGKVNVIKNINNKLYIGGSFTSYNGTLCNNIISINLDGTVNTNFAYGSGFNNEVTNILFDNTSLYILGSFTTYNGNSANRIISLSTDGTVDTNYDFGTGFNGDVLISEYDSIYNLIFAYGTFTSYNDISCFKTISISLSDTLSINSDLDISDTQYFYCDNKYSSSMLLFTKTDFSSIISGSIDTTFTYDTFKMTNIKSITCVSLDFYTINQPLYTNNTNKIYIFGDFELSASFNNSHVNNIMVLNLYSLTVDTSFTNYYKYNGGIGFGTVKTFTPTKNSSFMGGSFKLIGNFIETSISNFTKFNNSNLSDSFSMNVNTQIFNYNYVSTSDSLYTISGRTFSKINSKTHKSEKIINITYSNTSTYSIAGNDSNIYLVNGNTIHIYDNNLNILTQSFSKNIVTKTSSLAKLSNNNLYVSNVTSDNLDKKLVKIDITNNLVNDSFYSGTSSIITYTIDKNTNKIYVYDNAYNIKRYNNDGSLDSTFNTLSFTHNAPYKVKGFNYFDIIGNNLYIGDNFNSVNGISYSRLFVYTLDGITNSTFMNNIGTGFNDELNLIQKTPNGNLLISGCFNSFNGVPLYNGPLILSQNGERFKISDKLFTYGGGFCNVFILK